MATLSYFTVYSAATTPTSSPSSQEPPLPPPSQQQPVLPTKIILPNKKPMKWSTGVAPGDYAGPPTTTKLRKYWGGNEEDPVTSDDLIWNKDFMGRMEKLVQERSDEDSGPVNAKEESSGFLSLSRAMSLDCVEVDLSSSLATPTKPAAEQIAETTKSTGRTTQRWRPAPTRREQDKWDRATKAATGGSDVLIREARRPQGDPKILAAKSREQYYNLKRKLQLLTLGIGGVGLVSSYLSYTPEITLSFGAGLAGSLIYMRMLGTTVDSMADGGRGLMKGAVGQPRLLVPVALVMIYNRWNGIGVPEYGLMHLELIPMLLGFFTYKMATFVQAIEEAVFVGGKSS